MQLQAFDNGIIFFLVPSACFFFGLRGHLVNPPIIKLSWEMNGHVVFTRARVSTQFHEEKNRKRFSGSQINKKTKVESS